MSVDRMPYTVDVLRNRNGWVVRRCTDQRYACLRGVGDPQARKVSWTQDDRRALTMTWAAAEALCLTLTELWRERGAA